MADKCLHWFWRHHWSIDTRAGCWMINRILWGRHRQKRMLFQGDNIYKDKENLFRQDQGPWMAQSWTLKNRLWSIMKDLKDIVRPKLSLLHLDQSWKLLNRRMTPSHLYFPLLVMVVRLEGASGRLEAWGADEGWENGRSQGLCQGF